MLSPKERRMRWSQMQRSELTEYHIYTAIAKRMKNDKNADIIARIGREEKSACLDLATLHPNVDVQTESA
jgi:hypothetical protein